MPDPMYRQIADDLRRRIESGEFSPDSKATSDGKPAPDDKLPSEIELRDTYSASRNTVRDAIKWLMNRGLVETRAGQGTFVVQKINPFITTLTGDPQTGFGGGEDDIYDMEVKAKARVPTVTTPRVEIQQATAAIALDLQLKDDPRIVSRHQQRSIDGTPWSLQTSFYPMRLVDLNATRLIQATDIEQGTVAYLAETLGIEQAGWRDLITVRNPEEAEASFFRLPDDGRVPVIETRRTAFDEHGTPIRLTVSVYPADRNQFAVNVGRVPEDVADPTSAADTHSDVTTQT